MARICRLSCSANGNLVIDRSRHVCDHRRCIVNPARHRLSPGDRAHSAARPGLARMTKPSRDIETPGARFATHDEFNGFAAGDEATAIHFGFDETSPSLSILSSAKAFGYCRKISMANLNLKAGLTFCDGRHAQLCKNCVSNSLKASSEFRSNTANPMICIEILWLFLLLLLVDGTGIEPVTPAV